MSSQGDETLLSEKALQLSLSPPRCPPFGTAHRSVLLGVNPQNDPYPDHHQDHAWSSYNYHSSLRERLAHLIYNSRLRDQRIHPHLALGPDGVDRLTRFLSCMLPLTWQNHIRDSGGFQSLCDNIVACSIPAAAVVNPKAARRFLRLTKQREEIHYGQHESQFIDVIFPDKCEEERMAGMVFFVHGGAWGSGKPWFYRLVAEPFLKLNLAVAIVGYRVYPDGDTTAQVQDIESAYMKLTELYPSLCGPNRRKRPIGFCVCGHSSGAHIALLMIVEQTIRLLGTEQVRFGSERKRDCLRHAPPTLVDLFVGLSGPYNIGHHFDYEAARGVEELSPMKPANGYTREQFRLNTPALRLQNFLSRFEEGAARIASLNYFFPRTLLIHGIEDDTVPFTATSEAARILRHCGIDQCQEYYVPQTSHQDAVVHLMLGGPVEKATIEWLANGVTALPQANTIRSKL